MNPGDLLKLKRSSILATTLKLEGDRELWGGRDINVDKDEIAISIALRGYETSSDAITYVLTPSAQGWDHAPSWVRLEMV